MIYTTPPLSDLDDTVLGMIDELRAELRFYLHEPRRWSGSLHRAAFAAAAQGSLSIEGYRASVESTAAVIDGEEPPEVDAATRQAIGGYRDALTCVLQMATVSPEINARLLQSLHFMMMRHDFTKNPGQWRPGSVWISDSSGNVVYEAPARDLLEPLVEEMLTQVTGSDAPPPVTAAMAHLNLTLIHPFSDGNGRMARCLQTFVLVGGGLGSPAFVSIEEYLGANTAAYYDVLTGVGAADGRRSAAPGPGSSSASPPTGARRSPCGSASGRPKRCGTAANNSSVATDWRTAASAGSPTPPAAGPCGGRST